MSFLRKALLLQAGILGLVAEKLEEISEKIEEKGKELESEARKP